MGVAATGRRVEVTATAVYRVVDGTFAEGWVNFDALGLLQQLGAIARDERPGTAGPGCGSGGVVGRGSRVFCSRRWRRSARAVVFT